MPRHQLDLLEEALLLGTTADFEQFGRLGDELIRAGARQVRVKLVATERSLGELLPNARLPIHLSLKTEHVKTNALTFSLTRRYGGRHPREVAAHVSCTQHPEHRDIWGMLTIGSTEFLRDALSEALFHCHPRPAAPILRTPQIQQLLLTLASSPRVSEPRVRRVGARGHIRSAGAQHAIERDHIWTDVSIGEAFEDLAEARRWAMDIQTQFTESTGSRGRASISRFSVFSFSGAVREAFAQLIPSAVALASQWYAFLRDRAKNPAQRTHGKPFFITFDNDALGSREGMAHLLHTLSRLPHVSCTSLHGNPYFHVALTDHLDGSSYELLSVSSRRVAVLPQGRATVHSLQRVCGIVFSRFREGTLSDFEWPSNG